MSRNLHQINIKGLLMFNIRDLSAGLHIPPRLEACHDQIEVLTNTEIVVQTNTELLYTGTRITVVITIRKRAIL